MNKSNPINQLDEIRTLMERSSRFISLSGLSGISAGIIALLGAAFAFFYLDFDVRYFDIDRYFSEQLYINYWVDYFVLIICALLVLVLALGAAIFFTIRRAKRKGQKVWTETSRLMLVSIAVPLTTGGLFSIILLHYKLVFLVAPSTLIFYGLALLNGSKYTLPEIKWLGVSEIVLGLVACLLAGYGLVFWAAGFGVLHIVYGTVMFKKYETAVK